MTKKVKVEAETKKGTGNQLQDPPPGPPPQGDKLPATLDNEVASQSGVAAREPDPDPTKDPKVGDLEGSVA